MSTSNSAAAFRIFQCLLVIAQALSVNAKELTYFDSMVYNVLFHNQTLFVLMIYSLTTNKHDYFAGIIITAAL